MYTQFKHEMLEELNYTKIELVEMYKYIGHESNIGMIKRMNKNEIVAEIKRAIQEVERRSGR